ncbi:MULTISPECIES: HAMP domain-containing sensor histidine kinase [Corallococcus]|uniref:HAMP domain-containing sensor histidine kinase n=1 Tax=Corallococcus TaxID=83461 RepID=UPI0011808BC1|nr:MULTISPECIES: HAMP domain-containing sensor histidine kinase [Corallococcus]NBD11719.1 HAMP domain-containing protein [Corallococcus silvisoli]TSC23625.1 HAMP domain-containing histidine kinase [Corallococcus sp. Z5C101001]
MGWGHRHPHGGPWGRRPPPGFRHHHPEHPHHRRKFHLGRLGSFVQARLRRRLFVMFGLTILVTVFVVSWVMNLTGGNSWRQETERVRSFVGHRFAEVWDAPAARDSLVRSISDDLDVEVELKDLSGAVVAQGGAPCPKPDASIPVMREDAQLGTLQVCYLRTRTRSPWQAVLPLGIAVLVLWTAAGGISYRMARPVDTLVRATQELGEGRLGTRASLHHHATGEFAVLAESFNDMAARIEKQMADQRELLAAVSHELRTPLARLRVLTELLRDGGGNPRTLDQVDREVVELDALVGELLASSRLDFGQLTPKALEAGVLAAQALERTGLSATLLQPETDDVTLLADATLLGRALVNLLDNARKHGAGVEALRLQEHGTEHLAFSVEDRGPGLLPGEETRIFQPFYRKDRGGEAREAGSLGLGLALVQRIARAHGGEVFAENRPDGGARVGFTVRKAGPPTLPVTPQA